MTESNPDSLLAKDVWRIWLPLGWLLASGVVGVVAYIGDAAPGTGFAAFGTAVTTAFAATVTGIFFGLLFGIPRGFTSSAEASSATAPGSSPGSKGPETRTGNGYRGNSNLEQVSDWLTKLILGATLTQTATLYDKVVSLATTLAASMGTGTSGTAFAGGLLVGFAVWGFLLGYLLVRRGLPSILLNGDADGDARRDRDVVNDAAQKVWGQPGRPDEAAPTVLAANPVVRAAAERIVSTPLERVPPSEAATWGKAQMMLGNREAAKRAFELARESSNNTAAIEGLMAQALYETPPVGYESAIALADAATGRTPWISLYLACAYGQQHQQMKKTDNSPGAVHARAAAFQAAAAAAEADGGPKQLLRSLLLADPTGTENDLSDFRSDPDFLALVGLSPPKS